jgi:hypothetical protein
VPFARIINALLDCEFRDIQGVIPRRLSGLLRIEQRPIVMWRDITQINAPECVMFSADTPTAEFWMRKRYGSDRVVFHLPGERAEAMAFKEAAEAANFTVIVLTKRLSANM